MQNVEGETYRKKCAKNYEPALCTGGRRAPAVQWAADRDGVLQMWKGGEKKKYRAEKPFGAGTAVFILASFFSNLLWFVFLLTGGMLF